MIPVLLYIMGFFGIWGYHKGLLMAFELSISLSNLYEVHPYVSSFGNF